jgi:hypothetical protein
VHRHGPTLALGAGGRAAVIGASHRRGALVTGQVMVVAIGRAREFCTAAQAEIVNAVQLAEGVPALVGLHVEKRDARRRFARNGGGVDFR